MLFAHISDLHLGKRVNGFSQIEEQTYILSRILEVLQREKPDALLIAGDVYDKSVPSAEAVELLDAFLVGLSRAGIPTYAISGNHDSPERLAFGRVLMDGSGIHLSPVYSGTVTPFVLEDRFGPVNIYLLPFLKCQQVRRFFPDRELKTDEEAVAAAIDAMGIDPSRRNVLVAHQFVTGAQRCESEDISIGGSDEVSADIFSGFDYVALGHLHGPQTINGCIRYSGSILKYSFSECHQEKSVTFVKLEEKNELQIYTVPLVPRRDMTEIRGSYEDVTALACYKDKPWQEDFLRITLTDEEDVPDAAARLRIIYPNLMRLDYDNRRTRTESLLTDAPAEHRSPMELFEGLYEKQWGMGLSEAQKEYLQDLIAGIQEDLP